VLAGAVMLNVTVPGPATGLLIVGADAALLVVRRG
jgi:hypothetical protein